jgi:uncharacterized protein (TIGR02118 family)
MCYPCSRKRGASVRTNASVLPCVRFEIITVEEQNVIKVSVLYPNTAGCRFDMNYYLNRHMPMVQQKLGAACKRMAVEEGIAGGAPGAPAIYVAMGHLYFDFDRGLPDRLRSARAGDPGRYSQLHGCPTHHSDQRS